MVILRLSADELVSRLLRLGLFSGMSPEELAPVGGTGRVLKMKPSEGLAESGSVLPGFCLVLSGRLEWADTAAAIPWVHPGRTAAGDMLPASIRAGKNGAECLYVASGAFLDLIESCPAWAVAMIEASEAQGTWR